MEFKHISVLPQECMDALNIQPNGIYVDATTGGAGHSLMIAQKLTSGKLICIDRDEDALTAAKQKLADFQDKVIFVKSNFEYISNVVKNQGFEGVDGVLFDLGVSSFQLDSAERGFSYMQDAPLDMRMDREQTLSAYEVVNTYPQETLRDIIGTYGEERFAGRIASNIVRKREEKPIETTLELVDIIRSAMPPAARREKQHPAKRSFQAIRIEVNGELKAVEAAMNEALASLNKGGRIAVISFHSLEDRIVKRAFSAWAQGCTCPKSFPVCICGNKPKIKLVSRGADTATEQELSDNPRARSAKLRVAEKL